MPITRILNTVLITVPQEDLNGLEMEYMFLYKQISYKIKRKKEKQELNLIQVLTS